MRRAGVLRIFLVLVNLPKLLAAVSKEAVAHVQCEVCHVVVHEADKFTKLEQLLEEDAIADMVDNLCSVKIRHGRWAATYDVVRKDEDAQLTIEQQDSVGKCMNECLILQKACQNVLRGEEERLVRMLKADTPVEKMRRKVCKKPCSKTPPKLKRWTDEAFSPRDSKEVEAEDVIEKLRAETGLGMKMYNRNDLLGMSEGDMEAMAAREAYASEVQAARLANKEL